VTILLGEARTCRGCGCDDNHACVTDAGPCSWALLDVDDDTGICSACAEILQWDPQLLAAADEILVAAIAGSGIGLADRRC
jgi:hypothetical protein